ncbi:MAG: TIR domain-containing protein, partial [Candidatus Poribacteria bacterium]
MYVFISYAAEDVTIAEKELAHKLKKAEIDYFFAPRSIIGGASFPDVVKEALNKCSDFLVLVSEDSLKSHWVMYELGAAWALGKYIVPILHECNYKALPDILRNMQYRGLFEMDRVIEEIKKRYEIATKWWDINHFTTFDEQACANVFSWIASGMSMSEVLSKKEDNGWINSKWGQNPDEKTVETMLVRAWDDDVININANKIPRDNELESELQSAFPFLKDKEVIVIRSSQNETLTQIMVGEAAAFLFYNRTQSTARHKVGMSGGTTLATMTRALKKYPCTRIDLYALENGLTPESVDTCANTLIGWIKYTHPLADIEAHALQYLGFDDSPELSGFPDSPSINRVLSGAQDVDVAFVGFWPITEDFIRKTPSFKEVLDIAKIDVHDLIEKDRAVGTILFHCIREDGTPIDNKLNSRIDSIKPETLVKLAAETEKVRSIVG